MGRYTPAFKVWNLQFRHMPIVLRRDLILRVGSETYLATFLRWQDRPKLVDRECVSAADPQVQAPPRAPPKLLHRDGLLQIS